MSIILETYLILTIFVTWYIPITDHPVYIYKRTHNVIIFISCKLECQSSIYCVCETRKLHRVYLVNILVSIEYHSKYIIIYYYIPIIYYNYLQSLDNDNYQKMYFVRNNTPIYTRWLSLHLLELHNSFQIIYKYIKSKIS